MAGDRRKHWVDASHAVGRCEPMLVVYLQGLGELDLELIAEDNRVLRELDAASAGRQDWSGAVLYSRQETLSRLWVLGAYECLRTLHQRASKGGCFDYEFVERIGELKREVSRLRMPMAKLERAGKDGGRMIAYPMINTQDGAAWALDEDTIVTRRSLSDALLNLLLDIRTAEGRHMMAE